MIDATKNGVSIMIIKIPNKVSYWTVKKQQLKKWHPTNLATVIFDRCEGSKHTTSSLTPSNFLSAKSDETLGKSHVYYLKYSVVQS